MAHIGSSSYLESSQLFRCTPNIKLTRSNQDIKSDYKVSKLLCRLKSSQWFHCSLGTHTGMHTKGINLRHTPRKEKLKSWENDYLLRYIPHMKSRKNSSRSYPENIPNKTWRCSSLMCLFLGSSWTHNRNIAPHRCCSLGTCQWHSSTQRRRNLENSSHRDSQCRWTNLH